MHTLMLSGRGRRWTETGHPWIFANDIAGVREDAEARGGAEATARRRDETAARGDHEAAAHGRAGTAARGRDEDSASSRDETAARGRGDATARGRGDATARGAREAMSATSIPAAAGELVAIAAPDGRVLGHGLYSDQSKIAVRLVERGPLAPRADWIARRVAAALALRARHARLDPAAACRLVSGDADGLPGLVVDRYADVLVLQCGTLAADRMRAQVVAELERGLAFPIRAVLDRSDASVRRLEGLGERVEWLRGGVSEPVVVRDAEIEYAVDVASGHKTGHYLDQRDNRVQAARHAEGARVLDVCCYDGLFALHALKRGAREAWCLDQNQRALERARANAERNGVAERCEWLRADALSELRRLDAAGERFDIVVVDPPAFAKKKSEVEGALRGYRELNRRALALCTEGGLLVSASCSYNVLPVQFLEVLRAAAADSGRRVLLEEFRGASSDHPVLLALPESWYLKCAFLRVV